MGANEHVDRGRVKLEGDRPRGRIPTAQSGCIVQPDANRPASAWRCGKARGGQNTQGISCGNCIRCPLVIREGSGRNSIEMAPGHTGGYRHGDHTGSIGSHASCGQCN